MRCIMAPSFFTPLGLDSPESNSLIITPVRATRSGIFLRLSRSKVEFKQFAAFEFADFIRFKDYCQKEAVEFAQGFW